MRDIRAFRPERLTTIERNETRSGRRVNKGYRTLTKDTRKVNTVACSDPRKFEFARNILVIRGRT